MQVHGHARGPGEVSWHLRRPHGPGPGQLPLWAPATIPRPRSSPEDGVVSVLQVAEEVRDHV
jgi:hypothetical protein